MLFLVMMMMVMMVIILGRMMVKIITDAKAFLWVVKITQSEENHCVRHTLEDYDGEDIVLPN